MECDYVRDAGGGGRRHRGGGEEGLITLDVHEIPPLREHCLWQAKRDHPIALVRQTSHPPRAHAIDELFTRQLARGVGCQNLGMNSVLPEAARYLLYVCFQAPAVWGKMMHNLQNPERRLNSHHDSEVEPQCPRSRSAEPVVLSPNGVSITFL